MVISYLDGWKDYLADQPEHPVYLPIRVRWDMPHDRGSVYAQSGQRVMVDEEKTEELAFVEAWDDPSPVRWEVLKAMVDGRKKMLQSMKKDPFLGAWISEYWRGALLRLCDLRLSNPGKVLKWFVTGGNRPGKTETCTYFAVASFLFHCRPYGCEFDADWKGRIMMLHETEAMSADLHHSVVYKYLPSGITDKAKHKKTKDTYFNYTSSGFADARFLVEALVKDETGRQFNGGGEWEFRNYKQELDTFQGGEFDCILSDELLPPDYFKTLNARLASRAFVTNDSRFLERIRHLKKLLQESPIGSIDRATILPLIGALMQSVHIVSFTPIKGYTALAKWFLAGAEFSGWRESPVLRTLAGCRDPRVPTYAQCMDPAATVFFMPSSANVFKPAYTALIADYRLAGERELRMRLHGHVDQDVKTLFSAWDSSRHLCDWKDIPRDGTLYVVCDPAPAKPWAICLYMVDALDRYWQIMEWPCESIPIRGGKPGPWAVVSSADRLNGDEGPAYALRLNMGIKGQLVVMWEMMHRFVRMMAETGDPWRGPIEERPIYYPGKEKSEVIETLEVAIPTCCIFDSRFVGAKVTERNEQHGEEEMTILAKIETDPNMVGIWCKAASGVRLDEGDTLISSMLAEHGIGTEPKFRLNRECTNTEFMFRNYTIPAFKEVTRATDEACKEWRDCLAYWLLDFPRYVSRRITQAVSSGWGY